MSFKKFENKIWLSSPTMHEEEIKFVNEAFETNWIAPLGPNVDKFEHELAEYVGIDNAAATSSGTSALHLAYRLSDVKEGDIVLCSDLTFSATVNPITYERAKQVFVDSEYETWNMDPNSLRKAFEKYNGKVKAVSLVHLYGVPAKIDEIIQICKEYNVPLIEDAAESLSATYKEKHTGTFGKFGVYSFNGNKIITTSGGGMLVSNDTDSISLSRKWATQSRDKAPWYQHSELGFNYRMSNILAGIGRGQLLHLEEHKALKTEIYNRYKEGLEDLPITMNPYLEDTSPNFWLSCMLINSEAIEKGITPEKIRLFLDQYNVESRPIWKPMHLQPFFKECDYVSANKNNIAEDIFNRGICLPSDIKMTEEEQLIVIDMIKTCFQLQLGDNE